MLSLLLLPLPLRAVAAAATMVIVGVAQERRLTATTFEIEIVGDLRREVFDARTDPGWRTMRDLEIDCNDKAR